MLSSFLWELMLSLAGIFCFSRASERLLDNGVPAKRPSSQASSRQGKTWIFSHIFLVQCENGKLDSLNRSKAYVILFLMHIASIEVEPECWPFMVFDVKFPWSGQNFLRSVLLSWHKV